MRKAVEAVRPRNITNKSDDPIDKAIYSAMQSIVDECDANTRRFFNEDNQGE